MRAATEERVRRDAQQLKRRAARWDMAKGAEEVRRVMAAVCARLRPVVRAQLGMAELSDV
jgi:hypothetical protein